MVDTDGAEGVWESKLCKEIGGERVDVSVVQKSSSEVAAKVYEEGALTWAPTSGAETVEVGALWGEGREQETSHFYPLICYNSPPFLLSHYSPPSKTVSYFHSHPHSSSFQTVHLLSFGSELYIF